MGYNRVLKGSQRSNGGQSITRTPFYIVGLVLTFASTVLTLIALCTNNWRITAKYLRTDTFYTTGLWQTCKYIHVPWYKDRTDVFCQGQLYNSESWIIACQILYTVSAILTLVAGVTSYIGLCNDIKNYKVAVPSLVLWVLVASIIFQLISVSVYGAKGIGDYTYYEPDYSIIIASVSLLAHGISAGLFLVETLRDS